MARRTYADAARATANHARANAGRGSQGTALAVGSGLAAITFALLHVADRLEAIHQTQVHGGGYVPPEEREDL